MSAAVEALARTTKLASRRLALATTAQKDAALGRIAGALVDDADAILAANHEDVAAAERQVEAGAMAPAFLDRLRLDRKKLLALAAGLRALAALPDPAGRVTLRTKLDERLVLERVTSPLGVLAVVFESRPDAVPQIAGLALKSGNAAILKGGREAARSAEALVATIRRATAGMAGIPDGWLALLSGREEVDALLALDRYVDLVIPRGGNALVRYVQDHTRIPVLGHAEGICHVYLDAAADLGKAVAIAVDAKTQYPAACNAAETLLVHRDAAARLLPAVLAALAAAGVELRGCDRTRAAAPALPVVAAGEADWDTEYGANVLSVRVVDSETEAIEHIHEHGSAHTESIVTEDAAAAERFLAAVDSAGVYWNASTRFADGFRYGFGAEVGISTSKLHARGPVGLEGLVTYRYLLRGDGQVVASYSGASAREFLHEALPTGPG